MEIYKLAVDKNRLSHITILVENKEPKPVVIAYVTPLAVIVSVNTDPIEYSTDVLTKEPTKKKIMKEKINTIVLIIHQ